MRAILFGPILSNHTGWKECLRSIQIQSDDLLIGIDAGTEQAQKLGCLPQIAVGDWDSLSRKKRPLLTQIPHLTLPRAKDQSDLFFAARAALELGAIRLIFLGVSGERPDHHLAMLYELANIASGRFGVVEQVEVLGREARYLFLSGKMPTWEAQLPVGSTVSIFPIGMDARGVTLKGFEYGLENARLKTDSRGLSNKTCHKKVSVSLASGVLVVMVLNR